MAQGPKQSQIFSVLFVWVNFLQINPPETAMACNAKMKKNVFTPLKK